MSRIGKQPIIIPQGVSVSIEEDYVKVSGPRGELSINLLKGVSVELKEGSLEVSQHATQAQAAMNWGTMRSLLGNAVEGVTNGFVKKLIIEGVGFKASVEGNELVLKIGFSHLVRMPIPEGLTVSVEKNMITVEGFDRQLVGHFAAQIRKTKKPEPYLGKGIRYEDEIVRRKAGKKAATGAA